VIAFDDGGQLIQHLVTGQVDLIKQDPVTILQAFDQGSFNKLEDETTTRL
jgi:hypothetical protein